MSAYDWVNCPLCQNKKRQLQERVKKERKSLSDDEFNVLLDELEDCKSQEEETETPVRQDQEIWLTDEGKLKGYVSMSCQHCGTDWNLEFEINPNKEVSINE